jgi:hypothetical protein
LSFENEGIEENLPDDQLKLPMRMKTERETGMGTGTLKSLESS